MFEPVCHASGCELHTCYSGAEREESLTHGTGERDHCKGSPDFGGGIDYHDYETQPRERIPMGGSASAWRERFADNEQTTPPRVNQPRTPREDQNPRGCSLHSMEPFRDWFCKRADMTSAAEYEATLCQLEDDPPDIRQYNANIKEERWTNFSLEGVKFPAMTVDVIQRGEALAIFERDLIIHFQQISRAAALYIRALLGGVKRALEMHRSVDDTTKNFPWSVPTTEEKRHSHAEGVLMVALTTLSLPAEAWKSSRLLRAVPNCRLVAFLPHVESCFERLEAQQRHFSYRAILVAIVSPNSFVLVFTGYRTILARYGYRTDVPV